MSTITITKEQLIDLINDHLTSTYVCTRVWSAWGYGTMSQDDFVDARETDLAADLAEALIEREKQMMWDSPN